VYGGTLIVVSTQDVAAQNSVLRIQAAFISEVKVALQFSGYVSDACATTTEASLNRTSKIWRRRLWAQTSICWVGQFGSRLQGVALILTGEDIFSWLSQLARAIFTVCLKYLEDDGAKIGPSITFIMPFQLANGGTGSRHWVLHPKHNPLDLVDVLEKTTSGGTSSSINDAVFYEGFRGSVELR
jgi:hypothetical protein